MVLPFDGSHLGKNQDRWVKNGRGVSYSRCTLVYFVPVERVLINEGTGT